MSRHDQQPPDPEQWIETTVRTAKKLADINRRNFMKSTGVAAVLGMAGSAQVGAEEDDDYYRKTRPTVWTEDDRENAQQNIDRYDWAQDHRDQVVNNADLILETYDLEELWRFIPNPTLPRSTAAPDSPIIEGYDHTFGDFDYAPHPDYHWKIVIEGNDGEDYRLPTNDFASYRESGRDDQGFFDPDLADDDLLVNEEYPDLPDDWGVDDSSGFVDDEGVLGSEGASYIPVSQYNYWRAIYGTRQMLMELGHAYMFTDEQQYARAAAVMLDRIADVYPESTLTWNRIFEASSIRATLRSYDAVFPGMEDDDELVSFLDGKADEYPELGEKGSIGQIRRNIEEGFIHQIRSYVEDYEIRGNFGMHQAALAVSAVVADDPEDYTQETIDFTFQPGTTLPGEGTVTGGDVLGFLVGSPQSGYMVDEEGYPTESSTHYNTTQQNSLEDAADVLQGYDAYEGADLYENPKFREMLDSHWQLTYGKYIPQLANTHGVGNPKAVAGATPKSDRVIQNADFALRGFDEYRTPELAQWAYMLNGLETDGLEMGIFHPEPEGIREDVADVIDEHGSFPDLGSNQQPAYGFTALRDGDVSSPRGVYQYYGRNTFGTGSGHTHYDTHNLGVYGYDLDLSPEFGRQGSDWEGNDLGRWVESTPAHNTVVVDEENVDHQWVGYPRHFDHTDRVQLMDIESRYAYPQTDEHRRTTAMIHVNDDTSYVVDFFRVAGGDDHHFSFHAMTSHDTETEGLDLETQDGGTYEGEDVAFTEGGLFSYLYDVERDNSPEAGFAVDWDIEDYWEVRDDDDGEPVHLRLTMLNEVDDVALATSRPAEQDEENNPEELPFMIAHREGGGDGRLESTFTSVIEPYEGARVVESAELVGVDGDPDAVRAIKVKLENGRTDYVVCSTDPDTNYTIDDRFTFSGHFGVYALRDGDREFAYANDATLFRDRGGGRPAIQHNQRAFEGTVEDFTKELSVDNELEVQLGNNPRDVDLDDMVGAYIYVEPADPDPIPDDVREDERYDNEARDRRNGVFRVEGVEAGRGNRATIDIGEHTPIRRFDTNDPDDGYSYSIKEGAEFVIPYGTLVD